MKATLTWPRCSLITLAEMPGPVLPQAASYRLRARIVDQGRSSPGSRSLPFFDRSGSVHEERLKQQGRRFPLFIFEMLTSTRRVRVSGFFVALTQRTHSQRAIGVISVHRFWIFCGHLPELSKDPGARSALANPWSPRCRASQCHPR